MNTFENHDQYPYRPKVIAKTGFYRVDNRLICLKCNFKFGASDIETADNIVEIHRKKSPNCVFTQNLPLLPRSRRIIELDDGVFRYEMKRLESFINWPDGVMQARHLAAPVLSYSCIS